MDWKIVSLFNLCAVFWCVNSKRCQNQNISAPAFGCKTERTSFFITGLPEHQELNFKGSKKCSVTLEFTEPLTLNLTCYRLLKNRNSYGPIKWRFKDQDLQTGDFNGCNATVHQTFNVTDENDGQEIVCEIKSDEEGGDEYEIKLGLKYEPPPTTAPTTELSDKTVTDSTTGSDKENEPTGTGISMMLISYCFAGIACVLILIVLVCVLVKHIKRSKRIKKSTTDVTYENLSGDTNRQFPPNLEALYAKPYDTRSLEEESPYAVTSYQDTDTYSVPYVETDVNKLYAKPVPKKDRKEQLYTKVLPKNQRKPKGSEVTYAEIEHTPTKRLVPKDNTATYSEIMSENYATANKGYENVCRGAYANTKDTEYAEPAYCEAKR